jgi:phage-related protein (TIGR01555 family)
MPDFAQLIGSGEENAVHGRLAALQMYRSLYRMTVMDAEETIETNEAAFAGVEQIMDKFSRRIVQASGMPHTIVLGEGSTGNTSGRTETEEWAATVVEAQQAYLTPKIKRMIELFAAIKGAPALPESGFEVTYASILAKPDSEKAAEYKTVADADDIYMRNGVLLPEEVRSRWSEDGFKFEIELSEDYDAQETDEQLLNKMGVQASGDDQANTKGRGNLAEGN